MTDKIIKEEGECFSSKIEVTKEGYFKVTIVVDIYSRMVSGYIIIKNKEDLGQCLLKLCDVFDTHELHSFDFVVVDMELDCSDSITKISKHDDPSIYYDLDEAHTKNSKDLLRTRGRSYSY